MFTEKTARVHKICDISLRDLIDSFGSTAGEYVMEGGSFAFLSVMIDSAIGISQKDMMSEIHQYFEIQNEENGGPSTVRIYSWI
jgi:hypothetical protein